MRVGALLLLAAALPAFGADQWLRLTTPHFELYTTESEKKGREAILYFEQVRSFFSQAAPVRGGQATFDFNCGPQKPFSVAIDYVPAKDPAEGIAGSLRRLKF